MEITREEGISADGLAREEPLAPDILNTSSTLELAVQPSDPSQPSAISGSEPDSETAPVDANDVSAALASPVQPEAPPQLRSWFSDDTSSHSNNGNSDDLIGPFVVLLLDEFCRRYGLETTALTLRRELESKQVAFPGLELWYEMHAQCQRVLPNPSRATRTTLERLVEFCMDPIAHRAAVAQQDVLAALSPVRISASPKHTTAASRMAAYQQLRSPIVRPSQRRSSAGSDKHDALNEPAPATEQEEVDEDVEPAPAAVSASSVSVAAKPPSVVVASPVRATKKARKKGRRSSSMTSLSLEAVHLHTQPLPLSNPLAVGTFGEPALVTAQAQDLRRDLSSQRLLDRALRHVRLEKISTEPTRALVQRLGFQSQPPPPSDAFATELVLERYGFAKRQDCALCQQSFLPLNLPCRVSFRCIMDVYDAWQYVPPDRATSTRFRAPLCYDAVQVCRFCAQLVHQHATHQQQQQQPQRSPFGSRRRSRSRSRTADNGGGDDKRGDDHDDDHDAFCSDPFALPPLLGDDVADHEDTSAWRRGRRRDEPLDDGRMTLESPAKAIVYALQLDSTHYMSSKEWEIINPDRSAIRQVMEGSVRSSSTPLLNTRGSFSSNVS